MLSIKTVAYILFPDHKDPEREVRRLIELKKLTAVKVGWAWVITSNENKLKKLQKELAELGK